jgi:L-alanine-DL-glutamate epimerase-like enolase superfamily enzyme
VSEAIIDGCEAVGPLKMAADVVAEPVRLDAGALRLGDQPGLGAIVDPDALKRYRVRE